MCVERERHYKRFMDAKFHNLNEKTIFEIGAGSGDNLFFFNRLGIYNQNIFANDMVPSRIKKLKEHFAHKNIIEGNILEIDINQKFDIVFQSTVFSSLLDQSDRISAANKMKQLLAPGGVILWYDFTFNNPKNKKVRGVKKSEVKSLFSDSKNIKFKRVTLSPPIGRNVKEAYNFFNFIFPFFRTHLIAVIEY